MRDLSRPARLLISAVIFAISYIPINMLWSQALPFYSTVVASASEIFANSFEFSDTTYKITLDRDNYQVVARAVFPGKSGRKQVASLDGTRKIDLVSYNLTLWASLLIATIIFVGPSSRWKYLMIAPVILFLWHICDVSIFAKNTRWILVKDLNQQSPPLIDYSYSWHWFWYWAMELNRRIFAPFLPLLLWIILCARSFLRR